MSDDAQKLAAYIAIGDLILVHGITAAIKLIQTLSAEKVTVADLRALKQRGLKPASEYFGRDNG